MANPQPETAQCVFCRIIAGDAPAKMLMQDGRHVVIEPLGPHAPGHALVIPRIHIESAASAPMYAGEAFAAAVIAAQRLTDRGEYNLLTSVGPSATQTVMHLHVHIIPRSAEDGLHHDWPWCRDLSTPPEHG